MTYVWNRGTLTSTLWFAGNQPLSAMSAGQTLVRCRFRWGFYADTATAVDLAAISTNIMSWGIVTTIGNGSETIPNARTASGDASPPAQRWVYWETRAPVVSSFDQAGGVVTWRDSGSTEDTQTRGMVNAPIMAPGDQLNIWASWAAAASWDASGSTNLWFGFEVLIKI
jgi:hypothetical protein